MSADNHDMNYSAETYVVAGGRPAHEHDAPVNPPIVLTSTYRGVDAVNIEHDRVYARFSNPTWEGMEEVVAKLENASQPGLLFPSGMAAVSSVIDLVPVGAIVLIPKHAYMASVTLCKDLERRGIIVDVSHLNDAGFKDVCATARRPFAASHSNARAVCGHPRNLADWQLRELADCGGIAGLNFCTQFLTDRLADPTRDDVLRHVDHVLETAGEDVLALGSDYDGCDVPSWLEPCDRIGALHELLACEFGRDIADKVFFRNARDFFERVESV